MRLSVVVMRDKIDSDNMSHSSGHRWAGVFEKHIEDLADERMVRGRLGSHRNEYRDQK